jgi:phosphatidylglycerol:prolipoprotein diacylglycerol transferase
LRDLQAVGVQVTLLHSIVCCDLLSTTNVQVRLPGRETRVRLLAEVGWPVVDRLRMGGLFALSPHGIFTAIGFLVGAWLLGRLAPRKGIAPEHVQSIVFWSIIGAIVGARLFYVLAHLSEFESPLEVLQAWKGGISLLGGIAGAVIVNAPRARRWGYRFFQVSDPTVVALTLGIGIGRIGDLIIGDHLGRPTSWPLTWAYHGGSLSAPFHCIDGICRATVQGGAVETISREGARVVDTAGRTVAIGIGVHQTALYDMLIAFLLFGVLWVVQRADSREGTPTLLFGLLYGLARLLEDSLRIDKEFFGLTGSQWTALAVATASFATLIWRALHRGAVGSETEPEGART